MVFHTVIISTLFCANSFASGFLPSDATGEILTDPGIHLLAKIVAPATEFTEGTCDELIRQMLATKDLAIPAANLWLEGYIERPENERFRWRQQAAVMILALGYAGGKEVPPVLPKIIGSPAGRVYAEFPDFQGMETRASLREYAAFSYLAFDPIQARTFALRFIAEDPFASRVCALIIDQTWQREDSRALLELAARSSWTTTIATALAVLKKHDNGMYITALELFRKELEEPAPFFRSLEERFRFFVRRDRLVEAFGLVREEAMLKTLLKIAELNERGRWQGRPLIPSPTKKVERLYDRTTSEQAVLAIQDIAQRDFGYTDGQSDEEWRAVLQRCREYVARRK